MRTWIREWWIALIIPSVLVVGVIAMGMDRTLHRMTVEYLGVPVVAFVYPKVRMITIRTGGWSEETIVEQDGVLVSWRYFGTPRRGVLRFEQPATDAQQRLWRGLFVPARRAT